MTQHDGYTIPRDVLVAHLPGEAVLLHMDSKRYYRLNDTAATIWRALEHRERIPDIVDRLCEEFEVSPDQARREAERVVNELLERSLLEDDR